MKRILLKDQDTLTFENDVTDYVTIFPLAVGKLRAKFEVKLEEIKLPPTTLKGN